MNYRLFSVFHVWEMMIFIKFSLIPNQYYIVKIKTNHGKMFYVVELRYGTGS